MASPDDRNLESLCVYTGTYNLSISSLSIVVGKWRRHSFLHTWRPLSLLYGRNMSRGRFFWLHKTKPSIHISSASWLHFLFSSKGSFLEISCSWNNPGSQRDKKMAIFWRLFSDGLRLSRLLVLLCTWPSPLSVGALLVTAEVWIHHFLLKFSERKNIALLPVFPLEVCGKLEVSSQM